MTLSEGRSPADPTRSSGDASADVDLVRDLLRGNRGATTAVVLLALLSAGATLALPLTMAQVIEALQRREPVGGWIALMVAAGLGGAVAGALSTYLLQKLGYGLIYRLRSRTMRHCLGLHVEDARRTGAGDLSARLTADAAQIKGAVEMGLQLPIALMTLCGSVVVMAFLDLTLLLITLVAFVAAFMIVIGVVVGLKQTYSGMQQEIGHMSDRFVAALESIVVIKACRAEQRSGDDLSSVAQRVKGLELKAARLESLMLPAVTLGQQVALVAVIVGGGARVLDGELPLSVFAAFLLYLLQLAVPVVMAASSLTALQGGFVAQERFNELFRLPLEVDDDLRRSEAPAPAADAPAVRFDGVSFSYGDRPALTDIDLVVPRRGLTAVVGRSGAGKSTMLGLIERFLQPTSGELHLLGRPAASLTLADLRGSITYVDQAFTLLADTVRSNLTLGQVRPVSDDELYEVLALVALDDAVRALPQGLDSALGAETDLSGGQRQRLALARALVADTPLVLLDEPSSQLDSLNELRLRTVVRRLAEDRAVVVVAHRLSTVQDADHVIVLADGRVAAQGPHDRLVETSPDYVALLNGQMLPTVPAAALLA